ncbi:MAG: hypothetical protein U9Q68_08310, partial [Euryarchaeota archaeon]|nr:hypothetical protein [Euryarchaeota archaeon]
MGNDAVMPAGYGGSKTAGGGEKEEMVSKQVRMIVIAMFILPMIFTIMSAMAIAPAAEHTPHSVVSETRGLSHTHITNPALPTATPDTCYWNMSSTTDWSDLYIRPGDIYEFNVTITVDPISTSSFRWSGQGFGGWAGDCGAWIWADSHSEILPGESWTGRVGYFIVFPTTPIGTVIASPATCDYSMYPVPPAVPENISIPVGITAGSDGPMVRISTDRFEYAPGDAMIRHLEIDNPTTDPVTFYMYLGVPQLAYW